MRGLRRKLLTALIATTALLATSSASAWWGPGVGGWDPQEAYLNEYGFFDPYGPTVGDIRRMHRDNWRTLRGYPVNRGVGLYGPTPSDVHRQHMRKMRRAWGYPA